MVAAAAAFSTGALVMSAGTIANADTASGESVPTVSADSLPTAQINGVVWDQVIVGSTVYATGSFTSARGPGKAAGTDEHPRKYAMAYDINSGQLLESWKPSLNAQGLTIAASSDGSTIYLGGDFTSVSGVSKSRVVAVDASTGAVRTGFSANANQRVKALEVSGSSVFVGGNFTSIGGQARTRLAQISGSTGVPTSWKASADREVQDITVPAGKGIVVVGGGMEKLNSTTARGMGAVSSSTGATQAWAVNQTIQNYGPNSAILSLSNDGNQVYGTGYDYNGPSKFEGSFAATAPGGSLVWIVPCMGDTYDGVPIGKVFYSVSHAHNCRAIGSHPELSPRQYQYAMATSTFAEGKTDGGYFPSKPKPRVLHWEPTFTPGSYTGKSQAGWTITANPQYVVVGGEFPSVNGTKQQGLARFAIASVAPNKQGPQGTSTLKPTLSKPSSSTVAVKWQAAYDRDNHNLTYLVYRDSTVVKTLVQGSNWWNRPTLSYTDTPPKGTHTYKVQVKDPFGNTVTSATTSVTL